MDARVQLEAERNRLEAVLLAIEQKRMHLMLVDDRDALDQWVEALLLSLGLVNAELASIRHRDESSVRQ
jgi:hypothetical protein